MKFSFERYRGASHDMMKERVAAVETPDARHVRFKLKDPWPDFLTFYGSATGAGWVVPKKYVEKVGDDGFKKAPIGAGPYKFVSFKPGVELTLEANRGVLAQDAAASSASCMRSIPDETTRLAALKTRRSRYHLLDQRRAGRRSCSALRVCKLDVSHTATWWLYFLEQWDPKSPWHDVRVRQAASLAIDRKNINQAITLGHSKVTGNAFVPSHFEFYWQPPSRRCSIPAKAKQLLAEAGHPNGIDAGPFYCDAAFSNIGEAIVNSLREVGIRAQSAAARTRRLLQGLFRKEAEGPDHGRQRRVRQRRDPARSLCRQGRRPTPTAAIPTSTSCSSSRPSNSTTRSARRCSTEIQQLVQDKVDRRADLATGGAERRRAAGRRVGHRADRRRSLDLALRGRHAEGRLIGWRRSHGSNPLVRRTATKKGETTPAALGYIRAKALAGKRPNEAVGRCKRR